jgi:hypothetical protein
MRLEERFARVDHDTIESTMTLTDPKAYTAPWVSDKNLVLTPQRRMRGILRAIRRDTYRKDMREPAATKK